MINKSKIDIVKITFYIAMVFGLLYLIGYGLFTENAPFGNIIFNYGSDSFSDFWECVKDNITMQPYMAHSCYPAITNLLFTFFAKMVPASDPISYNLPASALNQMIFIIYNIVVVSLFFALINKCKSGNSYEKTIFLILILLSAPFIYMLERGNIIFVALIALMAFVWGKDSKNKWIREISYICLGFAAAIKIYPAVFGLLLLKDKNYKAAARCIVYGLMLFVIPFAAYDGLNSMKAMILNIMNTNLMFKEVTGLGYKVNMVSTLSVILGLLEIDKTAYHIEIIIAFFPYIYIVFAVFACLFQKSNWKTTALLSSMIVLVPGYSYVYSLIFFLIPLIAFLDSKDKRTWVDWICLACFLAMLIPIVFDIPSMFLAFQSGFRYTFGTFVQGIAVLIISIVLMLEGLLYGIIRINELLKFKINKVNK